METTNPRHATGKRDSETSSIRCIANDQLFYLLIQMIRLCSMNENLFFRSSFIPVYLLVSSALLSSLAHRMFVHPYTNHKWIKLRWNGFRFFSCFFRVFLCKALTTKTMTTTTTINSCPIQLISECLICIRSRKTNCIVRRKKRHTATRPHGQCRDCRCHAAQMTNITLNGTGFLIHFRCHLIVSSYLFILLWHVCAGVNAAVAATTALTTWQKCVAYNCRTDHLPMSSMLNGVICFFRLIIGETMRARARAAIRLPHLPCCPLILDAKQRPRWSCSWMA